MTDKDYDPFSYGQVRMAPGQAAGPGGPEDILFANGGPVSQAAVSDPSWDAPAASVTDFGAVDFGSDILGEQAAAPAPAVTASGVRKAAAQKPATPVAAAKPTVLAAGAPVAPAGVKGSRIEKAPPALAAAGAAPPKSKPVAVPAISPIELPSRARGAMLVSFGIVGLGAGIAAWLQFARHNTVLAGIAGAFALALAGVAWFGLRR